MHADYARRYRELYDRHWWWRSREAFVLGWVDRLHARAGPEPWSILDVGCGDGLLFDKLGRFGRVEGLEPDASVVNDPRRRGSIRVGALGDGSKPLTGSAFDLVLMLDVLEHVGDDLGALREVRDAVRPGGVLLLTVPALGWLWSRHDEVNAHARRYDRWSLRDRLDGAGFAVEAVRYFFAWTVGPLVVRRWLSPAGGDRGRVLRTAAGVAIPPAPVNRLLTAASRAEHEVGRVVPWPVGSSLLAVARAEG